jgi:acetyltransferase-like isoleucine patch superfamily enzyme
MSNNSFLTKNELLNLGLKTFGDNVLISRKASFYAPEEIIIGNNVRIDDFCILSGKIEIGSYVHISAYCALYGKYGIKIDDYSGTSPRVTVFSATDEFSGEFLIGPMVNKNLINLIKGRVYIKKYVQIGAGSIILPDITINDGCAVGALSLINKSLNEWGIYAGIPARYIKERRKGLLDKLDGISIK